MTCRDSSQVLQLISRMKEEKIVKSIMHSRIINNRGLEAINETISVSYAIRYPNFSHTSFIKHVVTDTKWRLNTLAYQSLHTNINLSPARAIFESTRCNDK